MIAIETGQRWYENSYPKNSVLVVEILPDNEYLVYSLEKCGTMIVTRLWFETYFHLEAS